MGKRKTTFQRQNSRRDRALPLCSSSVILALSKKLSEWEYLKTETPSIPVGTRNRNCSIEQKEPSQNELERVIPFDNAWLSTPDDKGCCDRGGVGRCEKTKAEKNGGQPGGQNQQQWERDSVLLCLEEQ
jgi:hypothetical protein